MLINGLYRLIEKAENKQDEELIKEVIATLENYEYLKGKMPPCKCEGGGLTVEGICAKCFGKERNARVIFRWTW